MYSYYKRIPSLVKLTITKELVFYPKKDYQKDGLEVTLCQSKCQFEYAKNF